MRPAPTSYPRNKIKVLLLENISDSAVAEFNQGGYLEIEKLNGALSEEDLMKAVEGVHLLGIRSKSQITANVIGAA
ncbi:MAG: phosphoglycerate dehydrogenase, partial [Acidobacteriota bacterium]